MACCAAWSLVVCISAYPCPPVLWRRTRSTVLTIELLREYDDGSSCILAKIEAKPAIRASDTHTSHTRPPLSGCGRALMHCVLPDGVCSASVRVAVQFVAKRAQAP